MAKSDYAVSVTLENKNRYWKALARTARSEGRIASLIVRISTSGLNSLSETHGSNEQRVRPGSTNLKRNLTPVDGAA